MAQIHEHVLLWAREEDVVRSVNAQHENSLFMAGTALSPKIEATADLKRMVQGIRAAEKLLGRGELSVRPCEQAAFAAGATCGFRSNSDGRARELPYRKLP
jgi:hypothetical protein